MVHFAIALRGVRANAGVVMVNMEGEARVVVLGLQGPGGSKKVSKVSKVSKNFFKMCIWAFKKTKEKNVCDG